jgi:hypothetical protein
MNKLIAYLQNTFTLLVILFPFFILTACDPLIIDAGTRRERKQFTFAIVDSNYYNLVDTAGKPYHLDSIKIYNQNGQQVDQQWIGKRNNLDIAPGQSTAGTGWTFTFNYLQGREVKNLKKYQETFYLYLNAQDTDTILVDGIAKHGFIIYFNGRQPVNENQPWYAENYFIK